jgi:hypothetical protein
MKTYHIQYEDFYSDDDGIINYQFDDIEDAVCWIELLVKHFPTYFWELVQDD